MDSWGGAMKPISEYLALSENRRGAATRYLAVVAVFALVVSNMTASQPASDARSGSGRPPAMAPAAFASCGDGSAPAAAPAANRASLPDYQAIVSPSDPGPRKLSYGGATVEIKPAAVRLPTGIGITPLDKGRLPKLDSGMTNVTGKG